MPVYGARNLWHQDVYSGFGANGGLVDSPEEVLFSGMFGGEAHACTEGDRGRVGRGRVAAGYK